MQIKFQVGDLVESTIPLRGYARKEWEPFDLPPGTTGIIEVVEKNFSHNRHIPGMSTRLRVVWEWGEKITLYSDGIYEYMIRPAS